MHLITVASQAAKKLMEGDLEGARAMILNNAAALGMDSQKAAGLIDHVRLDEEG
ncbi:MAG: hypothetical protein R3E96_11205 [Planctomycetota bacterium]